jgi:hypothetical protein
MDHGQEIGVLLRGRILEAESLTIPFLNNLIGDSRLQFKGFTRQLRRSLALLF